MSKPASLKLLSFVLQPFVMFFVSILFFVFVGVASIFITSIHIFIVSRRRFLSRGRHHDVSMEFDFFDCGVTGISLHDLNKLPCFSYGSVLNLVETRDCAVCLEGFQEEEVFRLLPGCKHAFHVNCIDFWLKKSSSCPICRRGMGSLN
ncbi:Ring-h2 finger protein [Thalictrum thalictroides]|uniref:Ring-h2 finger protein n=1 Tax=Thalictrum thalictroides TaxID=46969 RepID=A0A7J6WJR7_THATH|nr:Ring-h2 finger protein [Thalictrum thalictroides]